MCIRDRRFPRGNGTASLRLISVAVNIDNVVLLLFCIFHLALSHRIFLINLNYFSIIKAYWGYATASDIFDRLVTLQLLRMLYKNTVETTL